MSLQPRKLANVFGSFTPPTGTSLENTPQAIDWIEICMTKDESNTANKQHMCYQQMVPLVLVKD